MTQVNDDGPLIGILQPTAGEIVTRGRMAPIYSASSIPSTGMGVSLILPRMRTVSFG